MNSLIQYLDPSIGYALGWTIIHSLWQAALVALLMSLVHKFRSHKNAKFKYGVSVVSMVAVVLISVVTFGIYYSSSPSSAESLVAVNIAQINMPNTIDSANLDQIQSFFAKNLEHINVIWGFGVLLFLLRFLFAYGCIKYLRGTAIFSESVILEQTLDTIKSNLIIDKAICIAESAKIKVPLVVGHIKPLILFPLGIVNMLSTQEVEAIITHELAHIKRYDYLTNILLTLIEILFYYHPAVWWISANVKAERENCCDDFALSQNIDKMIYAKALVKLEEIKSKGTPALAMPFSSKKHLLINRIKRIMNMPQTQNDIKEKSVATILLLSIVILFSTQANSEKTSLNSFTLNEEVVIENPTLINEESVITQDKVQNESIFSENNLFEKQNGVNKTFSKDRVISGTSNDLNVVNEKSVIEKLDDRIQIRELGKIVYEREYNRDLDNMEVDTIPSKRQNNSVTIITEDNGKSVEMKKENGKIVMLKIDGEEIPESEYDEYEGELNAGGLRIYNFNGDSDLFERFNDSVFTNSFGMMFDGMDWSEFGGNMDQLFEGDLFEKLKDMEGMEFDFEGLEGLEQLKELERLGELEGLRGLEELEGLDKILEELGIRLDTSFDGLNFDFKDFEGFDGFDHIEDDNITIYRDRDSGYSKGTVVDKIGSMLNKDGLLQEYKSNKVEITGKHLKINGEKMPKALFEKYKDIYQGSTGAPLTKKSKMVFEVEGKPSKRKIKTF